MSGPTNTVFSRTLSPGVIRVFGNLAFRTDGTILDLAVSPDGTIWTVEAPGTIRRWQPDGKQIGSASVLSEVELLWAFSPNGRWLAAGSDELALYSPTSGELVFSRRQPAWITALAFDCRSQHLATGHDDGRITVWLADGLTSHESWPAHDGPISVLAFSPDGRTLASAGEDRRIRLWDASTGRLIKVLEGHTDRIHALAWHPDGRVLAAAGWDTMARIWDTATGEPIILLNGHAEVVSAAVFSPDGRRLVTADSDHILWVWDHERGQPLHRLRGHAGEIWCLAFAPDGKLISGGEDRRVLMWDIESGRSLTGTAEPVRDMARLSIHPDGQQIAFVNGSRCLWIWNPHTGTPLLRREAEHGLTAAVYSPDGKLLAVGDDNGGISVLSAENHEPIHSFAAHKVAITDLAFRADGSVLASSGATDGYVYLWNVSDWEPRLLIPEATGNGTVERIAWVPNSSILLACGMRWRSDGTSQGQIVAWDVDKPGKAAVYPGVATRLAVCPDGRQFAATDGSELIGVWNLETGKLERELDCESGPVVALIYSPDSRLLAAACADGSLWLWDARTLAVLKQFEVELSLADAAFAPDGKTLYAANPGVLCYAVEI
ncbi:MAG: WD40 repeat domain-containing protein [Gemmatales bacterium]|nr:WD40 repeat domain-containing protein [Gemmatales bacterium]MDW8387802.1 WD40 repeat domain-containing protein [Gemmatales bacterium]